MWERRLDRLPQVLLHGGAICIAVAERPVARLFGLAWMHAPRSPTTVGLLIPRCRSIHTFGMRFPLDLIWLDASGRILDVEAGVPPNRTRRRAGAAAVVETHAGDGAIVFGAIARSGVLL